MGGNGEVQPLHRPEVPHVPAQPVETTACVKGDPVLPGGLSNATCKDEGKEQNMQTKSVRPITEAAAANHTNKDKEETNKLTKQTSSTDFGTAAKRVGDYLRKRKHEKLLAAKPEADPPAPIEQMTGLAKETLDIALPKPPASMQNFTFVSADEQQPPKPRGRKKKAKTDPTEEASKTKEASGSNEAKESKGKRSRKPSQPKKEPQSSAPKAKPTPKPKASKAKDTNSKQDKPTKSSLPKEKPDPVAKPKARKADRESNQNTGGTKKNRNGKKEAEQSKADSPQPSALQTTSRKRLKPMRTAEIPILEELPTKEYEPMAIPANANGFDIYASQKAKQGIEELTYGSSSHPEPAVPVPVDNEADEAAEKDMLAGHHDEPKEEQAPKKGKSAEQKARNSRKSCAYSKELRRQLKLGVPQRDAKIAAQRVSKL